MYINYIYIRFYIYLQQKRRTSWVTEADTQDENKKVILEEIVLDADSPDTILGISITGGYDAPNNTGNTGIFVHEVLAGGLAAQDGRLQKGDCICALNGETVNGVTHAQAIDRFRKAAATGRVVILVSRLINKDMITREQEFHTRHGVNRESHIRSRLPEWQPGSLGAALEENAFIVEIIRGIDGFGLDLIGSNNENGGGIFISGVRAGSPAAKKPSICRGLQILEVNGWHVLKARLDDVIHLFAKEPERITLTLCANPEAFSTIADTSLRLHYLPTAHPYHLPRYVTLVRDATLGFGLNIIGPAAGDDALKCRGVFVCAVLSNSPASVDSLVRPGDRILEINGWSTRDVTHFAVAETLKHLKQPARMMLAYSPEGMAALLASVDELDSSVRLATEGLENREVTLAPGDFLCMDLVGADDGEGVFVARSWGSAAAKGIHTSDQILEVDDIRTHVSRQIRVAKLLRHARQVRLASNPSRLAACYQRGKHTYTLSLERGLDNKYGFSAVASSKGLQVTHITKCGPLAGRLAKGDEILEINGCFLRGLTFNEALEVLNKSGNIIYLTVYHNNFTLSDDPLSPPPHEKYLRQNSVTGFGTKLIKLQRSSEEPFGFGLGSRRNAEGNVCGGVVVAAILPHTPAANARQLCAGDQIVRVNGQNVETASVEEVKMALMRCTEVIIDVIGWGRGLTIPGKSSIRHFDCVRHTNIVCLLIHSLLQISSFPLPSFLHHIYIALHG